MQPVGKLTFISDVRRNRWMICSLENYLVPCVDEEWIVRKDRRRVVV